MLEALLRYVLGYQDIGVEEVRKQIASHLGREQEEHFMSTLERVEQRGEKRGEQLKQLEIARRMREEGSEIDFICRVTGLTEQQLREEGIIEQ